MKYSDFERECEVLKTPEELAPPPELWGASVMDIIKSHRLREHSCACGRRVIMAADLTFCPFCGERYER
jgi:hypothetical protein